jgi:hypothetical protein
MVSMTYYLSQVRIDRLDGKPAQSKTLGYLCESQMRKMVVSLSDAQSMVHTQSKL